MPAFLETFPRLHDTLPSRSIIFQLQCVICFCHAHGNFHHGLVEATTESLNTTEGVHNKKLLPQVKTTFDGGSKNIVVINKKKNSYKY